MKQFRPKPEARPAEVREFVDGYAAGEDNIHTVLGDLMADLAHCYGLEAVRHAVGRGEVIFAEEGGEIG